MMIRAAIFAIPFLFPYQPPGWADTCDPLRPNPPQNLSREIVGKIDARLDGITGRLLNAGGNIDGTYKEASSDVLKDYPNADKLYLWDRTLFLYCLAIIQSKLPDTDKADRVEHLLDRIGKPPAGPSGQVTPSINQTTHGPNSPAIAGVGGNVTIKGGKE